MDVEGSLLQISRFTSDRNGHTNKILRLNQKLDLVHAQADHIDDQIHQEDARLTTTVTRLNEETEALSLQLQQFGYDVLSLNNLKSLVRIWNLGIGEFDVRTSTLNLRQQERMRQRYGENLSFDLWTLDCRYKSNEGLQELKEFLDTALVAYVNIVERQTIIRMGLNSIVAEFQRRDVVAEREKQNRASARQEDWVARSAED